MSEAWPELKASVSPSPQSLGENALAPFQFYVRFLASEPYPHPHRLRGLMAALLPAPMSHTPTSLCEARR